MTLDDDLSEALRLKAKQAGLPFKQIVNATIRRGLEMEGRPVRRRRYRLEPASLGPARGGLDLDRALRLAELLEDSEVSRKLELRK